MYSLPDYGRMLGEKTRFGAYCRALERAVRPGDVVIDLGAGPGVFALLAARAGAGKVYAIEPDPVLALAPKLAAVNGVPAPEIVPRLSTEFEPAQRADVVICDLRGVLPTFTDHLPTLVDARERLLALGGRMIPRRDLIWAAPVEAPRARQRHLGGFERQSSGLSDLDLGPALDQASHLWTRVELESENLRAEPGRLVTLDYPTLESPNFKAEHIFEVEAGELDGLVLWFDAELDEVERFSNAPSSKLIYGQAFFPFRDPISAQAGDSLALRFSAHHMPGDDYLYSWAGELRRRGERIARFRQSTFNGTSVWPEGLTARSPEHRPRLNAEARLDAAILELFEGGLSLGEAAAELRERFSGYFEDDHSALRRVCQVADRYASS